MTLSKKKTAQIDPGLQAIDAWHATFLSAHTQHLADRNLPPDEFERDLAGVTRIAEAIAARMRSDYLVRRSGA